MFVLPSFLMLKQMREFRQLSKIALLPMAYLANLVAGGLSLDLALRVNCEKCVRFTGHRTRNI
jgi:hypothetical protein